MNSKENEFFRQATILICGTLDIETAFNRFFQYVRKTIPADGMYLQIYHSRPALTHTFASTTLTDSDKVNPFYYWPTDIGEQLKEDWKNFNDVLIADKPEFGWGAAMAKLIGRDKISLIAVPLNPDGKVVGGLVAYAKGFKKYTKAHANLLHLLREPIAIALSNALRYQKVYKNKDILADDNKYLHQELLNLSGSEIIGADSGLKHVMEMVRQVAPQNSPVLLLGETGVGKEVIANAIHYTSARSEGPFIKVNCGAIPENLIDSELFGHEKGAFTGAISQKRGRFERADKGTIFLDEIGELPLQAQVRLLRVLHNKVIERVGGSSPKHVDVRIISATNKDLNEMVSNGEFRDDLLFRLNVFPIVIPPLRERKGDIPSLVHHFINRQSIEMQIDKTVELAPGAIECLHEYNWPGNIRELGNIVERALILDSKKNKIISLAFDNLLEHDPKPRISKSPASGTGDKLLTLDELNTKHINRALEISGGKINGKNGAAEILNIHPHTLRKRMDKLSIPYGKKRKVSGASD